MGGASCELVAALWLGGEVSEPSSESEGKERWVSLGISSSSLSSSASSSSEAQASTAAKEGRPRLPVGADLRRGAAVVLVDLEAGRGGLKEGVLRLRAGLEIVGGMTGRNGVVVVVFEGNGSCPVWCGYK